jgi:hypothetical protein
MNGIEDARDVTVPVCEACWMTIACEWEPEGVRSDGNVVLNLKKVHVPPLMLPGTVETCFRCDNPTFVGIYLVPAELDTDRSAPE